MIKLLNEIKYDLSYLKSHTLQPRWFKMWKQSWLDFVVIEENGEMRTERIGKFYYSAVIINVILSLVVSQVLP